MIVAKAKQLIHSQLAKSHKGEIMTKAETLAYSKKVLMRTSAASVPIQLALSTGKVPA